MTHNKTYADTDEELKRRLIFEENFDFIEKHNANPLHNYTLAMNQFGDLVIQLEGIILFSPVAFDASTQE